MFMFSLVFYFVGFVGRELGLACFLRPCGPAFLGVAGVFWLPGGCGVLFWICRLNMVPLLYVFLLALHALCRLCL